MSLEDITMQELRDNMLRLLEESRGQPNLALAVNVGNVLYKDFFAIQGEVATAMRQNPDYPDMIVFAKHDALIDFGRNPKKNEFLNGYFNNFNPYEESEKINEALQDQGIKFTVTKRPGGPAYLGPGQLNVYPIVKRQNVGIPNPPIGQHKLDLVMKQIAYNLGVRDAEVKDHRDPKDRRDVYMPKGSLQLDQGEYGTKIGSKVAEFKANSEGKPIVMYNGFSFFVNREATQGFGYIPACGYQPEELNTISIQEILESRDQGVGPITMKQATDSTLRAIQTVFGYENRPIFLGSIAKSSEVKQYA